MPFTAPRSCFGLVVEPSVYSLHGPQARVCDFISHARSNNTSDQSSVSETGLLAFTTMSQAYVMDIPELVSLLCKSINLSHGTSSAAQVGDDEPLFWSIVHNTPPGRWEKLRLVPGFLGRVAGGPGAEAHRREDDVDLVIVVDCIYHSSSVSLRWDTWALVAGIWLRANLVGLVCCHGATSGGHLARVSECSGARSTGEEFGA
jgi:hypothetical protein